MKKHKFRIVSFARVINKAILSEIRFYHFRSGATNVMPAGTKSPARTK